MVNVARLQEPAVAAMPPNGESVLFAPDDPVLPRRPGSMAFGDHRWDLSILGLAANQVAGSAVLNFDRFLKPLVLCLEGRRGHPNRFVSHQSGLFEPKKSLRSCSPRPATPAADSSTSTRCAARPAASALDAA